MKTDTGQCHCNQVEIVRPLHMFLLLLEVLIHRAAQYGIL